MPELAEPFETWFLQRVARAIEAGDVPADLLAELRTEAERAREVPQEEGHALAVQAIAERLGLPVDRAEEMLTTLESQPAVKRELVLRRIVEAWRAGQRKAHGTQGTAKEPHGAQ